MIWLVFVVIAVVAVAVAHLMPDVGPEQTRQAPCGCDEAIRKAIDDFERRIIAKIDQLKKQDPVG